MGAEVDSLDIKISASATRANNQIDKLINNISKLSASLGTLNTGNLTGLANGVQKLSTSMQGMSSVKGADFTRIATGITKMSMIDTASINRAASAMTQMGKSLSKITGTAEASKNISDLAKGISQLGYKSATNAIDNIPKLATAMKRLMNTLASAPQVSQNLIDMTNALAKLARTGSSGGRAANTLVNSFNRVSKASIGLKSNLLSAVNGISAIRRSILSSMGVAGGLYAVFQGIKESINISSDLTEVQNVVDVTFGDFKQKIEDLAKVSIPELGMSELTVKKIASRFQAMGVAMGIPQGKMADMSTELTRLAGDMRSFWNVASPEEMGEDLEAIFTGQTKPLRQYGIDLTEATLQEWAMNNGINANINSMTQLEKTMLRYQYVMANTTDAQGDFLRTQDTWANQIVILIENLKELAKTLGNAFINILKPVVTVLNKIMGSVISFAENVVNALGAIFGWKLEITGGGAAQEYEDAADSADDLASGTGKAADNAKKLKQQLQGIDELNVLSSDTNSGNDGSGSGGGATSGADTGGAKFQITETESPFKSSINTLYQLGEYIGTTLTNAMKSIDWNSVYQGAKDFGSGLASFLNGLISPELFGEVGKTIAGSLNTALYALNSFGKTFDWKDFGESIASGINNFFQTFDFASLANTLNVWVDGIKTTVLTALKKISWSDVLKGGMEFLTNLDLDTIAITVGAFKWFHGGKEIVAGALNTLMKTQISTGIGEKTVPLSVAVSLSIATAITSFKIGNWLYDNVQGIQKISDGIAAWIMKDGDTIAISRTIGVSLVGLSIALPIASIGGMAVAGTLGASLKTWALTSLIPGLTAFFTTTLPRLLPVGGFIVSATLALVMGLKFGEQYYEDVTGEEAQGGIGDIIKGLLTKDISWSEIGNAISDGAVVDISLTPALRWVSGDETITTDEVVDAGEQMISDIVEKMKALPGNVIQFTMNVVGKIDEKAQQIKDWFANKKDEAKSFIANVKADGADKLKNIKEQWNGIKKGTKKLAVSFKDSVSSKLKKVKKAWDSIVGKAKKLSVTFTDNFTAPIKRAWNRIAESINSMVDKIPVVGKKIASVPKFPGYEQGGYPQKYSLFMAGENGIPEIAGTVGGKTAVAGGAEITGIRDAIYSTSQQEMEYLREQNQLLQGILAKEFGISKNDIGKASRSYARDYYNRTGKEAYSF